MAGQRELGTGGKQADACVCSLGDVCLRTKHVIVRRDKHSSEAANLSLSINLVSCVLCLGTEPPVPVLLGTEGDARQELPWSRG